MALLVLRFVAALLPIVCAWIAKSGTLGKTAPQGGYDNSDPRGWLARQVTGARANAAQANSFESLPFFHWRCHHRAPAAGARQTWLDLLAMLFVMLRMFYIMMYVSNMPTARSGLGRGVHGECRDLVRGLSLSCGGFGFCMPWVVAPTG